MAFISATAAKVAAGNSSNAGGYLTASKLGDGEHFRVSIVSESPLEYWTVWGETDDGQKKPFRFPQEPTPADITQELGDFKQRMNYEGTELEKPKFGLSFFVYDHADAKIKIFEITQKTLIGALDKLSQDEDYADIHAHDLKFGRKGLKMATEYSILPSPRKEGMQAKIDAAWSEAQDKGYDLMKLMNGENPFGA
jgi:hypothetical protein